MTKRYIITYDLGTTSMKTVLYELGTKMQAIADTSSGYDLRILENGGVEQDPSQWWEAMCATTNQIMKMTAINFTEIIGLSFCAQMQGLVLVDEMGEAIRPAMSYMDNRGSEVKHQMMKGGIKVEGLRLNKLLRSVLLTGVAPTSVKDPVWRYNWVKHNEPEVFAKVHKWLDVKEYLIVKATDQCVMTVDSAFATLLLDKKTRKFNRSVCISYGVNPNHMPKIVECTTQVGGLTEKAAEALGLVEGTPVYGGGGDASLIGVGAGATKPGDTHIYMGTSGWVSTVMEKQILDIGNHIAGIVGAQPDSFNYFAELETAGKCIEWVRDHMAKDEIDLMMYKMAHSDQVEEQLVSQYDYMMSVLKDVPPGSHGVIFTPWLHGNRCPFEDPNARGMYFNIGLNNGKRDMIHATLEGVCLHLKWQMEAMESKVSTSVVIRLVGGGALAELTCQMLANVLDKTIEVVANPQNAGAMGAALLVAVGNGAIDHLTMAAELIEVEKVFCPNRDVVKVYEEIFPTFKSLYHNNKKAFYALNHRS